MKKRFYSIFLALLMLFAPSLYSAHAADITNAEKLLKQLEAGSGFSGSWTVDLADRNGNTLLQKPFAGDITYIYVRPDEETGNTAAHELTLAITEEEQSLAKAAVYVQDGDGYLQSDLLGENWYHLHQSEDAAAIGELDDLLRQFGIPSIMKLGLAAVWGHRESGNFNNALDQLAIQTDLWLEAYRTRTVLGKTEEDKSTLTASYAVPAEAIKAHLKQLLQEILTDTSLHTALALAFNEDTAQTYLNAGYLSFYCDVVDALPLTGEAVLERTVFVGGGTAALRLSLPLYDTAAGDCVITYDQQCGRNDQPDETAIMLQSGLRSILISFQQYSSITGVSVLQGEVHSTPVQHPEEKSIECGFTLTHTQQEDVDEQARSVYSVNQVLTVTPLGSGSKAAAVPATEIMLTAAFASGASQKAATEVTATLLVGGDDLEHQVTVTLNGKSCRKWDVTSPRDQAQEWTQADRLQALPKLQPLLEAFGQRLLAPTAAEAAPASPAPDAESRADE